MNYATIKHTAAQKLTAGLLSFAITAVVVTSTVLGMTAETRSHSGAELAVTHSAQVQAAL